MRIGAKHAERARQIFDAEMQSVLKERRGLRKKSLAHRNVVDLPAQEELVAARADLDVRFAAERTQSFVAWTGERKKDVAIVDFDFSGRGEGCIRGVLA